MQVRQAARRWNMAAASAVVSIPSKHQNSFNIDGRRLPQTRKCFDSKDYKQSADDRPVGNPRFKFGFAGGRTDVRTRAESPATNAMRLMLTIPKPGVRASVHGVRAPLPSLLADEADDGLEKAGEEMEEKERRRENATQKAEPVGEQTTSEMSAADATGAAGIVVKDTTALRHTEIPRPSFNFQPSRRFRSVSHEDDGAVGATASV